MKTRISIGLFALLLACSIFSCKEGEKGRRAALPAVSGATNELLVVMPKELWQGSVGDTIKEFFGQPQLGLPQAEPLFDMINLPPANFEKNVRFHRNILIVSIKNSVDSTSMVFYESPWARTQKIFSISAPNTEEFYRIFNENRDKMLGVYLKAEQDRLVEIYKKNPETKIFNLFKNKYQMLMYFPGGYIVNKDSADFVWISAETYVDSKGVIFFQENYEHQSQLDFQVILDRVNEELKKFIPGPLDSTWMGLDVNTPMTAANYQYDGKHYAILIKGLWTVVNDFMGGPFVLNVVLDEKNNRIIYLMGYVYAPEGKKRNMLRQVESILNTMQIDYPEEEKKKE